MEDWVKHYKIFCKSVGDIIICCDAKAKKVHLKTKPFFALSKKNYKAEKSGMDSFPICYFTMIDGIKIYCIEKEDFIPPKEVLDAKPD